MNSPTVIQARDLSKSYKVGTLQHETMLREVIVRAFNPKKRARRGQSDMIWALKDVNLAVTQGEVVGVVGRNGSGKSTLLKVLSRITYPTTGAVRVRGRVASMLEVGTGFHEELSGRENIFLNGSILGMKRREIEAKIDSIIEYAGVAKFIDTPIKRYSTGMRLRLGFSVAAHLEPDILLVDEVLAVGDAEFQKKCLQTMDGMRYGGRTVLFVSHNMSAVESLCRRVIWIDKGKIRKDGDAADVIRSYLSEYTSDQMGSVDLDQITERQGSGEARFSGLEIRGSDDEDGAVVRAGGPLKLRLRVKCSEPISNPSLGVEIVSDLGTLITSINSWNVGFEVPELGPGEYSFEATVDSLPITPGRYFLSLWLSSVGKSYDRLDQCASLDVEDSDFYGTGRGMERMYGYLMLPSKWGMDKS